MTSEKKTPLLLRLEDSLLERLNVQVDRLKSSKSGVVKHALIIWLEQEEQKLAKRPAS
jgi:hypothetical protein